MDTVALDTRDKKVIRTKIANRAINIIKQYLENQEI